MNHCNTTHNGSPCLSWHSVHWVWDWGGREGKACCHSVWVVRWSFQPVLTLFHPITLCSHLTRNCMEI